MSNRLGGRGDNCRNQVIALKTSDSARRGSSYHSEVYRQLVVFFFGLLMQWWKNLYPLIAFHFLVNIVWGAIIGAVLK
jgi:hypothetical protein